jgi:hypothetical protein
MWSGYMSDLNPKGISFYPMIVTFLVEAYKFVKFPDPKKIPIPAPAGEGYRFEHGQFTTKDGRTIAVSVNLYSDGIWGDTSSSTDDSEDFLSDLLTRYTEIFQSPDYNEVIKKKAYVSQIFVSTARSLLAINPKLQDIAALLTTEVAQPRAIFEFGGVSFWPDQVNTMNPFAFTFERPIGVPFSENRYYSQAPLPTDKHLELLNMLEDILS